MIFRRKRKPLVPDCVPAPVANPSPGTDCGGARRKILVVDDDPIILKTLALKLQSLGCQVVTAREASEALNLSRKEQPDLALVEVNLTSDMHCVDWNGFIITEWLQHLAETKDMPVILMSGSDQADYGERAAAAGAVAFLRKPISNDELLASVELVRRGGIGWKPECIDLPFGDYHPRPKCRPVPAAECFPGGWIYSF